MASTVSFTEFPEDVQVSILSFLTADDVSSFCCASKRFAELYKDGGSKLWHSLCERRWGPRTCVPQWGQGRVPFKLLYATLLRWDRLLGFWRRCGGGSHSSSRSPSSPALLFFEWGPRYLSGSRIFPSEDGGYEVVKAPFLWMGISPEGRAVCYLDPDGDSATAGDQIVFSDADSDLDLVPVNVDFIGMTHLRIEEDAGFSYSARVGGGGDDGNSSNGEEGGGSPEEKLEIYQYYANRGSPGALRRLRKRGKDRLRRLRRWETEHFLKIVDSSPTPARPLQGLWKGICEGLKLEFYLVTYDGAGLSCRRVGDLSERLVSSIPVFWTSNPVLVESPLSPEDALIYDSRIHLRSLSGEYRETAHEAVTHFMNINSSYDLVLPGLVEAAMNPWRVEGRIWQYKNGTFGFGFLRDNFIVDLRHIAQNGCLLDILGSSGD